MFSFFCILASKDQVVKKITECENFIHFIHVSGFLPPGFTPVGSPAKMSRRGSVCGSNVPLITELGRDIIHRFPRQRCPDGGLCVDLMFPSSLN